MLSPCQDTDLGATLLRFESLTCLSVAATRDHSGGIINSCDI